MPLYQYTDLKHPTNIRIVKVRGAAAQSQDVECEIIETRPEDLAYEALTWYWGNAEFDHFIRIHEQNGDVISTLKVSKDLQNALKALRCRDRARYLWVDAICIHQAKIEERNEQVRRMDDIYGRAENVCIWLGKENENSKLAMKFIHEKVLNMWGLDKLCDNLEDSDSWVALAELMMRPWFSRRWVREFAMLCRT